MSGIRNPNTDDWTPERYATAMKMKAEGKSAGAIAKALGGTTRNAVVGKIWRMNPDQRATRGREAVRSADFMAQSANKGVKTKALALDLSPAELLRPRRFSWEEAGT